MSRKNAREDTFRIIFESLINTLEPDEYIKDYFEHLEDADKYEESAFLNKPVGNDNEYVKETVAGVLSKKEELDAIISENLIGWEVDRISKVSIAAMRLALYEMMYADDIPVSVTINEAIEIAKKYDGTQCASFVNGALASAVKKLSIEEGKTE